MKSGKTRFSPFRFAGALAIPAALVLSGCATHDARKHLQGVAKGWCETIRASQVIPVYPLTQDLVVGDVFLVQTPISQQEEDYEKRGFLPLDDHRVRLTYTNFSKLYFDGYWQDGFGKTPHPVPEFTNAGTWSNTMPAAFTPVPAPRAAFPTYSFQAQSGFGLSAAFPIYGVPVALSYLRTDQVNGSVTIADARTYAGDEGELLALLHEWADQPRVRSVLSETVRDAMPTRVYLRVVSRVYLTRAVEVSLRRAKAQSASATAGTAGTASLFTANGMITQNYSNLLNTLNSGAGLVADATQVGGAVKFVSASESSVGMAQSFDRLLVIGYLGFDVPVYPGGDLGVPVPTFLRLLGKVKEPPEVVGPLSVGQAQFKANQMALEALAAKAPARAVALMCGVVEALGGSEFSGVRADLATAAKAPVEADQAKKLVRRFGLAAVDYVSVSGRQGPRYTRYNDAFASAFSDSEEAQ